MPVENFYKGLDLGQAVRKFADHHWAPQTRHISGYERALLERAAEALEGRVQRDPQRERDEAWSELDQAYWTGIAHDGGTGFDLWSVPLHVLANAHEKGSPMAELQALALAGPPDDSVATPQSVQGVLAALLVGDNSFDVTVERLQLFRRKPSEIRDILSVDDFQLLNRAMYQPAVPVEASEPQFKALKDLVETGTAVAGGSYVWITHSTDNDPLAVLLTASTIIVVRLTIALTDRLSEAIHDWRREPS